MVINEDRCKSCGLCVSVCPVNILRISDRLNSNGYRPAEVVDPDNKCTRCRFCAFICPDVAIEIYK